MTDTKRWPVPLEIFTGSEVGSGEDWSEHQCVSAI